MEVTRSGVSGVAPSGLAPGDDDNSNSYKNRPLVGDDGDDGLEGGDDLAAAAPVSYDTYKSYEYPLVDDEDEDDNDNDGDREDTTISLVDKNGSDWTPKKRRRQKSGGSVASSPSTTGYLSDGSEDTFDTLSSSLAHHQQSGGQNSRAPSKLNPSISRFSDYKLRTRLWDAYRLARVILGTQPLPMNGNSNNSSASVSPNGKNAMPNLKKGTILHAIRVVAEMKLQISSLQNRVAYAEKAAEALPDMGPLVVVKSEDSNSTPVTHHRSIGAHRASLVRTESEIAKEGRDEKKFGDEPELSTSISEDVSKLQLELKASRQQYEELNQSYSWLLNETVDKLQHLNDRVDAGAGADEVNPSIRQLLESISKASAIPHIHAAQARADKKLALERLFHAGQVTQLEQQLADAYLQLDGLSFQAEQQGRELQKSARKLVRAERKLSATTEQMESSAQEIATESSVPDVNKSESGESNSTAASNEMGAADGTAIDTASSSLYSLRSHTEESDSSGLDDSDHTRTRNREGSFQSAILPSSAINDDTDDAKLTPHQREIRQYQRRIVELERRLVATGGDSESTYDSDRRAYDRDANALMDQLAAIPETDIDDESENGMLQPGSIALDEEYIHLQLQLEILKAETSIPHDRLLWQKRTAARRNELDELDKQLDVMAKNAVMFGNHETSTSQQLRHVQDQVRMIREQQERYLHEIEARELEEQEQQQQANKTGKNGINRLERSRNENTKGKLLSPKFVSAIPTPSKGYVGRNIKARGGTSISPIGSDSSQDDTEATHACIIMGSGSPAT